MTMAQSSTLEELCELITDGTHFSPPNEDKGDFLYITSKNIRPGRIELAGVTYVSREVHEKIYSSCPVEPGDVLYVKDGVNTGTAALNELAEPFSMLSSVALIRPDQSRLDSRYLMHWLNSPQCQAQMLRNMSGAAIKRLVLAQIRQSNVFVPPLHQQRRIAAILDQADALRRKRRTAIDTLRSMVGAVHTELITTKSDNTLQRCKLNELCTRITDGTHQAPTWTATGVPFIFVSNVRNGEITLATDKFVSESTYADLTRNTRIEKGDVLYTAVGSYGNAAVVKGQERFIFQRHIAHIKPRKDLLDSDFLAVTLESAEVRRQADHVAKGVAQKTVTLSDLKEFEIVVPPIDIQRQFSRQMATIEGLKNAYRSHLVCLDNLFASLQHRAFRGEL